VSCLKLQGVERLRLGDVKLGGDVTAGGLGLGFPPPAAGMTPVADANSMGIDVVQMETVVGDILAPALSFWFPMPPHIHLTKCESGHHLVCNT
jgi:hypothetical protein